jgi:hypothetical protein
MRTPFAILLFLLPIAGCDMSGAKFIAPSSRGVELASHNGFLLTIPGSKLLEDGTMGTSQNVLYLLVVCPDLTASAKGRGTDHGRRINTYICNWETPRGSVSVSIAWDKRADTVTIGGKTFTRGSGNVFVVKRERTGDLSPLQLPSIGSDVGPEEALRFIQGQMSNDAVVAAIRLPLRD